MEEAAGRGGAAQEHPARSPEADLGGTSGGGPVHQAACTLRERRLEPDLAYCARSLRAERRRAGCLTGDRAPRTFLVESWQLAHAAG